jgi:hypothetical protein
MTNDKIDGPRGNSPPTQNKNVVEMHGCIVCARIFNILAVYTPVGGLVGCVVTSPGGHCVPDEQRPLVACDTHTTEEIETAYKRWQSSIGKGFNNEQEDE